MKSRSGNRERRAAFTLAKDKLSVTTLSLSNSRPSIYDGVSYTPSPLESLLLAHIAPIYTLEACASLFERWLIPNTIGVNRATQLPYFLDKKTIRAPF